VNKGYVFLEKWVGQYIIHYVNVDDFSRRPQLARIDEIAPFARLIYVTGRDESGSPIYRVPVSVDKEPFVFLGKTDPRTPADVLYLMRAESVCLIMDELNAELSLSAFLAQSESFIDNEDLDFDSRIRALEIVKWIRTLCQEKSVKVTCKDFHFEDGFFYPTNSEMMPYYGWIITAVEDQPTADGMSVEDLLDDITNFWTSKSSFWLKLKKAKGAVRQLGEENMVLNLNSTFDRVRPGTVSSNLFCDFASLKAGDEVLGSNFDGEPAVRGKFIKCSDSIILVEVDGKPRPFRSLESMPRLREDGPVVEDEILRFVFENYSVKERQDFLAPYLSSGWSFWKSNDSQDRSLFGLKVLGKYGQWELVQNLPSALGEPFVLSADDYLNIGSARPKYAHVHQLQRRDLRKGIFYWIQRFTTPSGIAGLVIGAYGDFHVICPGVGYISGFVTSNGAVPIVPNDLDPREHPGFDVNEAFAKIEDYDIRLQKLINVGPSDDALQLTMTHPQLKGAIYRTGPHYTALAHSFGCQFVILEALVGSAKASWSVGVGAEPLVSLIERGYIIPHKDSKIFVNALKECIAEVEHGINHDPTTNDLLAFPVLPKSHLEVGDRVYAAANEGGSLQAGIIKGTNTGLLVKFDRDGPAGRPMPSTYAVKITDGNVTITTSIKVVDGSQIFPDQECEWKLEDTIANNVEKILKEAELTELEGGFDARFLCFDGREVCLGDGFDKIPPGSFFYIYYRHFNFVRITLQVAVKKPRRVSRKRPLSPRGSMNSPSKKEKYETD